MFCNKCGNEIKKDMKFCNKCGAKLKKSIPLWVVILITVFVSGIVSVGVLIIFNNNRQAEQIENNVQNNVSQSNSSQNTKKEEYIFTPYQNVEIVSQSGSIVSFRGICPNCGEKTKIDSRDGLGASSVIRSAGRCSGIYCDWFDIKIGVKVIEF